MADCNMNSLKSQIHSLMNSQPDFPQKIKQHLLFESNNVTNHFKFIASLFTKGVLCDGSNDPEGSFGLKEMMVQLAIMIACAKGSDAVGGLMEALEQSGHSQVTSALRTWINKDFGTESNHGGLSKTNGDVSIGVSPEMLDKQVQVQTTIELSLNDTKVINKIISHVETELIEQLEGHLVGKASKVVNVSEFCTSLVHENVLDENDSGYKTGSEQWAAKAIKAACSKKAIGSLVVAFKRSGNENLIDEISKWLETSQARKKNYPVLVKSLPKKLPQEKPKPVGPKFFEQAASPNEISKVANFNYQPDSKASLSLEFNQKRMIVHLADSTVKLWNWIDNEEKTMKFGEKVKLKPNEAITSFQYDDEILVLGTSAGTVYLYDARTLEEKWSVRLGEPIDFLKFVKSSIIIRTRELRYDRSQRVWWVDISRPKMQLLNQNVVLRKSVDGILNLVDLISTREYLTAGGKDGTIVMWKTSKLRLQPCPYSSDMCLRGHTKAIVSLCAIKGHLVSVDQSGKLLLWSGYDLENDRIGQPIPRILAENFNNVSCLAGCERWLASSSSKDGVISIWTLPDLWLRTG